MMKSSKSEDKKGLWLSSDRPFGNPEADKKNGKLKFWTKYFSSMSYWDLKPILQP